MHVMNMKKIITMIVGVTCVTLLAGCEPSSHQLHINVLPDELKACKFHEVNPGGIKRRLVVVTCPAANVTTITPIEKSPTPVVIINGVHQPSP